MDTLAKQLSGSKDKTLTVLSPNPTTKNLNLVLPYGTSPILTSLISDLKIFYPLSYSRPDWSSISKYIS